MGSTWTQTKEDRYINFKGKIEYSTQEGNSARLGRITGGNSQKKLSSISFNVSKVKKKIIMLRDNVRPHVAKVAKDILEAPHLQLPKGVGKLDSSSSVRRSAIKRLLARYRAEDQQKSFF